jgi:hypothetical protein
MLHRFTPCLVALTVGCGSGLLDGSKEKHKGTADGVAGSLPSGYTTTLSFERTIAESNSADAALVVEVKGAKLLEGTLRAPDGSTHPLVLAPTGESLGLAVRERDDNALMARIPNGSYVLEATLADGSRRSVTIVVQGGFPPYPETISPADGASGVPQLPVVTYSGVARRFDVSVLDETAGARTVLARGTELLAASPGAPLAAGRRHTLEIGARAGPTEFYRYASIRLTRFSTAP